MSMEQGSASSEEADTDISIPVCQLFSSLSFPWGETSQAQTTTWTDLISNRLAGHSHLTRAMQYSLRGGCLALT